MLWTSVIEPKILSKQLKTCDVAVGALSSTGGRTPIVVYLKKWWLKCALVV